MGREQLDRTKKFTDDGKLRGIISSAKFVPIVDDNGTGDEDCKGFGQLFKVRAAKDEEVEKELEIIDGEKPIRKRVEISPSRKLDFSTTPQISTRKVDFSKTQNFGRDENELPNGSFGSPSKKRKRSMMVVLKLPRQVENQDRVKRRRVQFIDV